MTTPREVLCKALPRSQDDFIADELLQALDEAGFTIVSKNAKPDHDRRTCAICGKAPWDCTHETR